MLKNVIKQLLKGMGYQIVKKDDLINDGFFPDMEHEFFNLYEKCRNQTMTSIERMYSLFKAVEYVAKAGISGDIVECGVWKGGSSMMAALTLKQLNVTDKKLYLYDTFEGMTEPTGKDVSYNEEAAQQTWKRKQKDNFNEWCYSPLEEVKKNMSSTGYPEDKIVYVKGRVEDTIPAITPDKISILRLDTDWYESTYHELKYLYPKLVPNGVLIIDDYGHWKGSKEAADIYFKENNIQILLHRIDYTGRIGIKNS